MRKTIIKASLPLYLLYWRVMKPETTRARVVLTFENQVLLVKHIGKKYWSLPGGKVEKGESFYKAMTRELQEELGIKKCIFISKLGQYQQNTKTRRDTVHVFVASVEQKIILKLQWEIIDARWFDINHLPVPTQQGASRRISEYKNGGSDIYDTW
jgi:8-oxo-dGTP pyrophosphatase MutT (NUDIX family)